MKRKTLLSMAGGMAALTVLGSYTAKPLWAQVKAALVQNIDEPGRNPYSSGLFFFNGPSCVAFLTGSVCTVDFQPVPAGKRLVATNLTGNILVQPSGDVVVVALNGGTPYEVPTLPPATGPFQSRVGINAPILAYFEGGTTPQLEFQTSSPFYETVVTLSGYLVSIP